MVKQELYVGPRSKEKVQLDGQTGIELDHIEHNSSKPSDSNLRTFSIFTNNGLGGRNLSSEADTSSQKRENRKPGRQKRVKVTPPPRNNYRITDLFKSKPKTITNSDRPNEPGVEEGRSEEIDTSSVLDEPAAVTRPIGL